MPYSVLLNKIALFGYFWIRILKKIFVIFEISTLKFVKYESLTHTVNFGIGSAFSEGPDPGPGPGTLYKVCPLKVDLKNKYKEVHFFMFY